MSGICALMRLDGAPVAGPAVDRVLDAMAGWGDPPLRWAPESTDSPVALGCRPMPVTPEDRFDRQPVFSADGAFVLVADARIDNRSELAVALGLAAEAAVLADSGFILAAYEAWGEACVRRLVGDFAFVLWDSRRRSLFAARDGTGQRVLYYHATPRWLSIASAPGALLELDHVPARLDEQKVADFLVLMQDPGTTFFRDVRRLPPGHTLVASDRGFDLRRFWSPLPPKEIRFPSDAAYLEAFHEVFGEATRARLRASSGVGVLLSAGLDSSAVAAVAAGQLRERGETLTAWHSAPRPGFRGEVRPGWIADESEDVRAIARMYDNIDLRIQRSADRTMLDDLDTLFRVVGMPVPNATNYAWLVSIYAAARRENVGVLLSGRGGNPTISYSGLRSLRDMARAGRWAHVLHEIRALARLTNRRTRSVLLEQILLPLSPRPLANAWSRLRGAPADPVWTARHSAIRPDFAESMRVTERLRDHHEDDDRVDKAGGLEYRASVLMTGDALDPTHALRAWYGVETRDPTSDTRVVEFCFGIPGSQYMRDGERRLLVRRALRGRLPESVLERRTRGAQAADWTEWLPPLRPAIAGILDDFERSARVRRCIDVPRLRALLERWPARLGLEHTAEYNHLLLRALMMGRFITWFESAYGQA